MGYGKRGPEIVRGSLAGGQFAASDKFFIIKSSSDDSNRKSDIVPGSIVCQITAGDSVHLDGAQSADTTGSAARLLVGIAHKLFDSRGVQLINPIIRSDEAGLIQLIPIRGLLLRILEDGDGGGITDANALGKYASLVISSPSFTSQADTITPNPEAEIVLDSSSIASGTASNRACALQGLDPDPRNEGDRRNFLFTFTDAFTTAVV